MYIRIPLNTSAIYLCKYRSIDTFSVKKLLIIVKRCLEFLGTKLILKKIYFCSLILMKVIETAWELMDIWQLKYCFHNSKWYFYFLFFKMVYASLFWSSLSNKVCEEGFARSWYYLFWTKWHSALSVVNIIIRQNDFNPFPVSITASIHMALIVIMDERSNLIVILSLLNTLCLQIT